MFLIYSGTPPSEPLDGDIGFYRRAFDSPSSAMTPVAMPPRPPTRKKSTKKQRLFKRGPPCAVCGAECEEDQSMCASCSASVAPVTPKLVASSRETHAVPHVRERGVDLCCCAIPRHDCDFLIGRHQAVLLWREKGLKNASQAVAEAVGALDRNSSVVGIIEWSELGRRNAQYERVVCQLTALLTALTALTGLLSFSYSY